jgi:hypothetical protein
MACVTYVQAQWLPQPLALVPSRRLTGPRLALRGWAGKCQQKTKLPRLDLFKGYEGWEPENTFGREGDTYRYEKCWLVSFQWLGRGFELMPAYQGPLCWPTGEPLS